MVSLSNPRLRHKWRSSERRGQACLDYPESRRNSTTSNGFQPLEPPAPHKGRAAAKAAAPPFFASRYWYWFSLLFFSIKSRSCLNGSTLSGFSVPAFIAFLFAVSQFSRSCSSILCLDGLRLFASMKDFTSLYRVSHLVSWSIDVNCYPLTC